MTPASAQSSPSTVPLWSLGDDVLVEDDPDEALAVVTRWGEITIADADADVREALRRMALGPISLDNVATEGSRARANLMAKLDLLSGSVVRSLAFGDGAGLVLSVLPGAPAVEFRPPTIRSTQQVRLSQTATMRPCDGDLLLESPLSSFQVLLQDPVAGQIVGSMARETSVAALARRVGAPSGVVADIVGHLVASMLVLADPAAEARGGALRLWSHHELMFHARSRNRYLDDRSDFGDRPIEAPLPVSKPATGRPRFALYQPQPLAAGEQEPTLTELLEVDHACPEVSRHSLTADQVGELLFRSARIREHGPVHLPFGLSHSASQRPYLNVACLYELELYLNVDRCADLPRGSFHYDAAGHALTMINQDGTDLAQALDIAKIAAGGSRRPAVAITVTARMSRVAVLGGGAYATSLLHLGALQQTLYLVAKAIGISAHAVPVHNGAPLDRILRLNWPAEVTVGQCVVDPAL